MSAQIEIILGVAMFTGVILALVVLILIARSKLVASGEVNIEINGEKTIAVQAGDKLLQTLSSAGLFLPSACGGGGSCAQCKCIINDGGGSMLPTEEAHFTRRGSFRRLAIIMSNASKTRHESSSARRSFWS